MTDTVRPGSVKSAMRTLDLIELVVARSDGINAREISQSLDIPMSSLSYLLNTLCDRQYLKREGRLYRAGPGLNRLRLPEASLSLADRMAPVVRSLRQELNETVSLMIRNGWEAEVVVTEASDQSLRYAIDPGEHRPLHTLAAGKVLLAELSPKQLDQYFRESKLVRLTPATIVDEAALRKELDKVRANGFAEAREESTPGICSIGAAVRVAGQDVAAVGVAVPSVRFTDELRRHALALLRRI